MMKLMIRLGMMAITLLAMVSCSSSSPSGALEDYMSALQNKKYEKFVDGINISKGSPDEIKQAREGLVSMMEEKADKTLEKNGGIKSIEIISEEIAEDGNSAVVKFKQVYGDGTEKEDSQKMVKVGGKWLMDVGK